MNQTVDQHDGHRALGSAPASQRPRASHRPLLGEAGQPLRAIVDRVSRRPLADRLVQAVERQRRLLDWYREEALCPASRACVSRRSATSSAVAACGSILVTQVSRFYVYRRAAEGGWPRPAISTSSTSGRTTSRHPARTWWSTLLALPRRCSWRRWSTRPASRYTPWLCGHPGPSSSPSVSRPPASRRRRTRRRSRRCRR